jgi:hypothetical protein
LRDGQQPLPEPSVRPCAGPERCFALQAKPFHARHACTGIWQQHLKNLNFIRPVGAELAVEYVVDQCMKNKGPMRWCRQGANALLQVRCAVLDGTDMLNFMRWFRATANVHSRPRRRPRRVLAPRFWPLPRCA